MPKYRTMNIIKKLKKLSIRKIYKLTATDGEIVASAYFANREDAEKEKNDMELIQGLKKLIDMSNETPTLKISVETIELVKDGIQEHNIHRHLQN